MRCLKKKKITNILAPRLYQLRYSVEIILVSKMLPNFEYDYNSHSRYMNQNMKTIYGWYPIYMKEKFMKACGYSTYIHTSNIIIFSFIYIMCDIW